MLLRIYLQTEILCSCNFGNRIQSALTVSMCKSTLVIYIFLICSRVILTFSQQANLWNFYLCIPALPPSLSACKHRSKTKEDRFAADTLYIYTWSDGSVGRYSKAVITPLGASCWTYCTTLHCTIPPPTYNHSKQVSSSRQNTRERYTLQQ